MLIKNVKPRSPRHEKYYTCRDEPYLDIMFNITMRSETPFYTVNLIVPCMDISFLTVLVFYLPSDSGQKASYTMYGHLLPDYSGFLSSVGLRRECKLHIVWTSPSWLFWCSFYLPSDSGEKASYTLYGHLLPDCSGLLSSLGLRREGKLHIVMTSSWLFWSTTFHQTSK